MVIGPLADARIRLPHFSAYRRVNIRQTLTDNFVIPSHI